MATIRKRKGKYQVQVRRKGLSPISRSFHTHADAVEWARHMEVKADRGELPAPIKTLEKHTLKGLLERYRDEISIKKKSHDNEKYLLNALIRQPFSNLTLAQITISKFSEYRDKRLKEVKPGTVRRELILLGHLFKTAERDWGIPIRENPLSKLPIVKHQAGRSRRLQEGEFEKIVEAAKQTLNPLILPMIRFALATAMRRGEIVRVLWADINFTSKILHIPLTKNGHARTIPLSSHAIAVLLELEQTKGQSERVFPMTENAFSHAWDKIIRRSGIEDLHFHDLRHEAISRFFEKGLAVPEVALISGHRDYRMLFRYTHLKPEALAEKLG